MTPSDRGADRSSWQRIDDICDRFEAAKREGQDPQISDFLNEAISSDERETLLRELLQLDIELSSELGETIALEKYLAQLPEDDQLVRTSFERHQTRAQRRSSTETAEPQLTPGQEFGSYTIIDRIGAGGMGHVYHARHVTMDRDVALKVLTPKLMDSSDAVARFHREIKAAAKLQHPNIVTAFDAGEQDGLHYLVMEFVVGSDLSSYIKSKGPLSLKQAIKCTIQAAKGLAYAHEQSIVHRDIKPSNLLVDQKGTVKVLDMGLARFEMESDDHELTNLTGTGMVMGTIDYMAPEQSLDTRTADARSDIYSLGCTFWYLLTGRAVYGGDTVMKKLLAHREEEIPSLRRLSEKVPESVDELFQKMVAKDQDDRYQSMEEVVSALQDCLQGRKPSDSNSDLSMAADPKLASFLKDISVPKATSDRMEYEESKSHTNPQEATVIGDLTAGSSNKQSPPSGVSTGKLPKWAYGVAGGVLAIIVAALLIPGEADKPSPEELVETPTGPAISAVPDVDSKEPDLPSGVTDDFTNAMTLSFTNPRCGVHFPTFPNGLQGPLTLEFWFIPIETPPNQGRSLITMGDLSFLDVRVWTNSSTWRPSLKFSDSESIIQDQLTPSPWGKPNHFAIVVEEGRLDFYINGFSQGQKYLAVANQISDKLPEFFNSRAHSRGFFIGPVGKSAFDVAPGYLLELRVSNTARYDGDFTPHKRFTPDEHTIALYHFDQGSGNTLKDHSGNGYHGVIHGAKWVKVDDELNVIEEELSQLNADPWAAEREVAEWVIEQGGFGYAKLISGGGTSQISSSQQLPSQPFLLSTIYLENNNELRIFDLERLGQLNGLEAASLNGDTHVNEGFLEILDNSLVRLSTLNINLCAIKSSHLNNFGHLKYLLNLQIGSHQIDDGWKFLKNAPRLQCIRLYSGEEEDLKSLQNFPRLRELFVQGPSELHKQVEQLRAANPHLRIFFKGSGVSDWRITGKDPLYQTIRKLSQSGIYVAGGLAGGGTWESDEPTPWSEEKYFVRIQKMSFPTGFAFDAETADDLNLLLSHAGTIEADRMINADVLAKTLTLWYCQTLSFEHSDLTDAGLQQIAKMPNLFLLQVRRSKVTEAGLEEFRKKRPLVRVISDFGTFEPTISAE